MLWESRGNPINIQSQFVRRLPCLKAFIGEHQWIVAFSLTSGLLNRTHVGTRKFRPLSPSTACYRLLPPITVSTSRPDEYRSAGTQVAGILHRYSLRPRIHFQRFDIEWVDEVIEV